MEDLRSTVLRLKILVFRIILDQIAEVTMRRVMLSVLLREASSVKEDASEEHLTNLRGTLIFAIVAVDVPVIDRAG